MANVNEIKQRISEIQQEVSALLNRPGQASTTGQFIQLDQELAQLERQLAREGRDEYANPVAWPLGNFYATGEPFVFQKEGDCVLGYRMEASGPGDFGLIAFHAIMGAKVTRVNDEVIAGHPLFGRGLRPYGCFECINSSWIRALQSNHSVHPQFQSGSWGALTHFIYCFKDLLVEVVSPGWKRVGVFPSASQAWEAVGRMINRLNVSE